MRYDDMSAITRIMHRLKSMLSGTYWVPDIYNNIPIYLSHIGLFTCSDLSGT